MITPDHVTVICLVSEFIKSMFIVSSEFRNGDNLMATLTIAMAALT